KDDIRMRTHSHPNAYAFAYQGITLRSLVVDIDNVIFSATFLPQPPARVSSRVDTSQPELPPRPLERDLELGALHGAHRRRRLRRRQAGATAEEAGEERRVLRRVRKELPRRGPTLGMEARPPE